MQSQAMDMIREAYGTSPNFITPTYEASGMISPTIGYELSSGSGILSPTTLYGISIVERLSNGDVVARHDLSECKHSWRDATLYIEELKRKFGGKQWMSK